MLTAAIHRQHATRRPWLANVCLLSLLVSGLPLPMAHAHQSLAGSLLTRHLQQRHEGHAAIATWHWHTATGWQWSQEQYESPFGDEHEEQGALFGPPALVVDAASFDQSEWDCGACALWLRSCLAHPWAWSARIELAASPLSRDGERPLPAFLSTYGDISPQALICRARC